MRSYTIDQYVEMSDRFNQMTFYHKIKTIRDNNDILMLANDYNWWGVKVRDKDIQTALEDAECEFHIEREWDAHEMESLVSLLGIDITDI